ncbi:MAG: hypothetical protein HND48_20620 [Chloroflexi bacterium]|nr:hypothetical protein [Chloroflexota bacterium]
MNALLAWTEADGLSVVTAWPDNSVPTSVEVAENGDVYVGFLGAGIAPGAGKVERWSGGALAETFGGLTGVTDILLAGDTLYAVQLFEMGAEGPGPGQRREPHSGRRGSRRRRPARPVWHRHGAGRRAVRQLRHNRLL